MTGDRATLEPPPAPERVAKPRTRLGPARRLEPVRRVDWRFLLPQPWLGDVLYIGLGDRTLLAGLDAVSRSVTTRSAVQENVASAAASGFDVVVLREPSLEALERVHALVRPGGSLYCELERSLAARLGRVLGSPLRRLGMTGRVAEAGVATLPAAVAALRRLGWLDIESHWHYPSFAACRWIVPFGAGGGVEYLARGVSGRGGTAMARLAAPLVWERVLPQFAHCVSVTARRGAGGGR